MKRKACLLALAMALIMPCASSQAQSIDSFIRPMEHLLTREDYGSHTHRTPYAQDRGEGRSEQHAFEQGATWDCGFSPEGGANPRVIHAINEVRPHAGDDATILVAAYELTSLDIARALITAHQRGVKVAVVADATENRKPASRVRMLVQNGIPVKFDNRLQMLHDKYLVLDGTAVETGSFNFTKAAASDEHAENACVFRHVPKMAAAFTGAWQRLWRESEPAS
ncbi:MULTISPECIES: phospholipase D-like domain-containing protein [unclassified Paraburkholderia]|uniref:phospholipase D-like domain-containing protein n=1 Tax=unclassified Paraburkholderia TaxID=2615204 RepID=UPI002AAF4F0E|nr:MULTISPECIES: phospholipase D-like domain-containing protein [unclassified Paraburkholderia]